MREIRLVHLDKTRPALVLTRDVAREQMNKVTIAPITTTIKGISSEVLVGPDNGLDAQSAISIDNVLTVPAASVGKHVGFLLDHQEAQLARAIVIAFDLDVPLLSG